MSIPDCRAEILPDGVFYFCQAVHLLHFVKSAIFMDDLEVLRILRKLCEKKCTDRYAKAAKPKVVH